MARNITITSGAFSNTRLSCPSCVYFRLPQEAPVSPDSGAAMDDALELRKLRKKLRQIETLEHLHRDLTPCEKAKVSLKLELRRLIEELLSRERTVTAKDTNSEAAQPSRVETAILQNPQKKTTVCTAGKPKAPPSAARVALKTSDSWDTSVRVWDIASGSEVKTLCGHTGAVTCLAIITPGETRLCSDLLPPQQHYVSSGSSDCSIKVWSVITGQLLLNIYTFSAVSAIVPVPNTGLLLSGSDGGKIDVWELETQANLQSQRSHEDKVTALQIQSGLLYSGSTDGILKVWRIGPSGTLSLLHSCDSLSPSLKGLSAICATADCVYVATQGAALKLVKWKHDGLTRLSNHTSACGFVDAVAITSDNLLVASGFNIDQGHGFLNVRDVKTGRYLSTLSHPDTSRLLCLALSRSPDGLCHWVTGGRQLLLWEELPQGATVDSSAVRVQFCADFLLPAAESDSEEEDENDLWEAVEEEDTPSVTPSQTNSWLRCLLM